MSICLRWTHGISVPPQGQADGPLGPESPGKLWFPIALQKLLMLLLSQWFHGCSLMVGGDQGPCQGVR